MVRNKLVLDWYLKKTVLEKINYRFVQPTVVCTGIHSVDAGTKSARASKKIVGQGPSWSH